MQEGWQNEKWKGYPVNGRQFKNGVHLKFYFSLGILLVQIIVDLLSVELKGVEENTLQGMVQGRKYLKVCIDIGVLLVSIALFFFWN